jgi:F-type H+-transporting ATPase subunit gamma
MSRSHSLELHLDRLGDLKSIMNAMKNMAYIEIHKLSSKQHLQTEAVKFIERAGQDFLTFFPNLAMPPKHFIDITVVIGSERGFCGDFNEALIKELSATPYTAIVAVGNRLNSYLQGATDRVKAVMAGANTADEIASLLSPLTAAVTPYIEDPCGNGLCRLIVIYHADDHTAVCRQQILPPFLPCSPHPGIPPLLNVEPIVFFKDLIQHYLMAVFQQTLTASLLAENQSRLRHLDAGVNHLEKTTSLLQRKLQHYRQEEITEEIEVLLLNTAKML